MQVYCVPWVSYLSKTLWPFGHGLIHRFFCHISICLLDCLLTFFLTNTHLCATLSILSFIASPPSSLFVFPRGLLTYLSYVNSAATSLPVSICIRIHAAHHPGDLVVEVVKGSFLKAKGHLSQIYYLSPKSAAPRILGIGYKSAPSPPLFTSLILTMHTSSKHTALTGVIAAPSQSNDRERESRVTAPHQTINQTQWGAHPSLVIFLQHKHSTLYFMRVLNGCSRSRVSKRSTFNTCTVYQSSL